MSNPTKLEKAFWNALCNYVGCIACFIDGNFNNYCSIHHIDGRTKPGCHKQVLPLCAPHHQHGSGNNNEAIAIHPFKRQFEQKYGSQEHLLEMCKSILRNHGIIK